MSGSPPTEARISDERLRQFIKDMSFGTESALPYFRDVKALLCELEGLRRSAPEPTVELVAYLHEIQEPNGEEPQRMYSATSDNPWSHWVAAHRVSCLYTCTPLYRLPPTKGGGL